MRHCVDVEVKRQTGLEARTSYILGAGASASSRAPVVANFPRAARKTKNRLPVDDRKRFLMTLNAWLQSGLSIEEYYVLCETMEVAGACGVLGTVPARDVQLLIAQTLREAMRGNENTPGRRAYARFVSDAGGPYAKLIGTWVISLNWDTCLETAAHDMGGGVMVPFERVLNLVPGGDLGEENDESLSDQFLWDTLQIVKLHGSMNWWYCKPCKTLLVGGTEKGIIPHIIGPPSNCSNCDQPATPAMVPPSSAKLQAGNPLHPLLATLWNKAAGALQASSRIVVIGYSFPDADMQFRLLVRAALAESGAEVVVVTRPQESFDACRAMYASKLGIPVARIQVYDQGFVKWVSRRGYGYPPLNEMTPWWTW